MFAVVEITGRNAFPDLLLKLRRWQKFHVVITFEVLKGFVFFLLHCVKMELWWNLSSSGRCGWPINEHRVQDTYVISCQNFLTQNFIEVGEEGWFVCFFQEVFWAWQNLILKFENYWHKCLWYPVQQNTYLNHTVFNAYIHCWIRAVWWIRPGLDELHNSVYRCAHMHVLLRK